MAFVCLHKEIVCPPLYPLLRRHWHCVTRPPPHELIKNAFVQACDTLEEGIKRGRTSYPI